MLTWKNPLNRKKASFSPSFVHEKIEKKNLSIIQLKNPIYHYSYHSIDDFLKKMQIYSSLFAKQNKEKKASFFQAVFHGIFAFFKSYIIKFGIFGVVFSVVLQSSIYSRFKYRFISLLE